jgi:hypothetical protein
MHHVFDLLMLFGIPARSLLNLQGIALSPTGTVGKARLHRARGKRWRTRL